ncbi:hypothetical protein BFX06_11105 [Sulfobacillus thermosulfidooxidans]|nr:hypothetical protein BFX05_02855 [Sulfobacillus thermosulfidooxidans]OLZ13091.1 hypothetical protein BFX06_11105 [Sulfobacillus thermosulfidooxidans]OLZ21471.1 hypothetical protein BFX07_11530 [Sulfobacillus thermosulfidooxidans]
MNKLGSLMDFLARRKIWITQVAMVAIVAIVYDIPTLAQCRPSSETIVIHHTKSLDEIQIPFRAKMIEKSATEMMMRMKIDTMDMLSR